MDKLKENSKYKTIGEVAKILELFNKKRGSLSTHTIRFWEKEFKQIKPKFFLGNRRYYDENSIKILKKIKFLLKDKGMTLMGVKKLLDTQESNIDELYNTSISQRIIKTKLKKIKHLVEEIKNKNG